MNRIEKIIRKRLLKSGYNQKEIDIIMGVPIPIENIGVTHITSFGFRYGKPVEKGAMIIDVRTHFKRNPYHDPTLRHLRGTDAAVATDILQTPNFAESYYRLFRMVATFNGPVYLGCTGGHHRSVYLAERIGRELNVPVSHRDIERTKNGM